MIKLFKFLSGFLFGAMLVCLGNWLGGYDFDQRGHIAVMCYILCIAIGSLFGFVAVGKMRYD